MNTELWNERMAKLLKTPVTNWIERDLLSDRICDMIRELARGVILEVEVDQEKAVDAGYKWDERQIQAGVDPLPYYHLPCMKYIRIYGVK